MSYRRVKLPAAVACVICNYWCVFQLQAAAQTFTFTTVAGTPGKYGIKDGVGEQAQFYFPSGVTVDRQGNLFVADTSNNTIRKLSPSGADWTVTTIAGFPGFGADGGTNDGVNGDARFWRPNGVVADPQGQVFVADHYNHVIRKIRPEGTNWVVTTIAGSVQVMGHTDGTNNQAKFYSPTGICLDSYGNLFVVDTANFIIRKVAPVGTNWVVSTIAGTALNFDLVDGTNADAAFNYPFGITVDISSNLYVADYGNNAIRKLSPIGANWVVKTIAGGITPGHADGTNTAASFNAPADITVDGLGTLYVSDQNNHTLRRIEASGTNWVVSTIAGQPLQRGSNNGVGTAARFDKPWGLALGPDGWLYVIDWRNGTVRAGVPASSAPPVLQAVLLNHQLVLSWPLSAAGFALHSSTQLTGNPWNPLPNISIQGTRFWVTNDMESPSAFFTLTGNP